MFIQQIYGYKSRLLIKVGMGGGAFVAPISPRPLLRCRHRQSERKKEREKEILCSMNHNGAKSVFSPLIGPDKTIRGVSFNPHTTGEIGGGVNLTIQLAIISSNLIKITELLPKC